jgi:hypothetical protein
MNKALMIRILATGLLPLFAAFCGSAATYYVDFNSGNDYNLGTGTNQAWQHCPGDANASGKAAAAALQPGNSVQFRGGVTYRGMIRLSASGTPNNPITYTGTGWGPSNAIISGGQIVTTAWTPCTNAQDCWGNPNFTNVWWTMIPTAVSNTLTLFYSSNSILPFAQYPTPSDPINWANWPAWAYVSANNVTTNILVDTAVLNQTNVNFWTNSWVVIWESGDLPDILPITGFIPASRQIKFSMDGPLPTNGTYYTLLNQPSLINAAGQVAIRPDENRVYLWPPNSASPNGQNIEYSAQTIGFWDTNGRTNIVLNGFKFVGVASALTANSFAGSCITNLVIQNCDISCSRAMVPHAHAICFTGTGAFGGFIASNCIVHDAQTCGITVNGNNIQVINSWVYHLSSYNFSGIYFLGVANGLVSNNIVHSIYGVHCNGITSYANAAVMGTNIMFANNWVYDCPSVTCMSLQSSYNINVFNNILDGGGVNSQVFSDYNGLTGNINIINNTIVGSSDNMALNLNSPLPVITVANNIIAGSTIVNNQIRYNNIYCGLLWSQSSKYGWSLASGESVCTNLSALFVNPVVMNWQLASNSPAIGAGTNFGKSYPSLLNAIFGGVRHTTGRWDVGACSSAPPGPPSGLEILNTK